MDEIMSKALFNGGKMGSIRPHPTLLEIPGEADVHAIAYRHRLQARVAHTSMKIGSFVLGSSFLVLCSIFVLGYLPSHDATPTLTQHSKVRNHRGRATSTFAYHLLLHPMRLNHTTITPNIRVNPFNPCDSVFPTICYCIRCA